MLSCSSQTLANYERKGSLHPQHAYRPDGRGAEHRVIVYSPHELTKLASKLHRHIAPRDPGEIAGRAYEMYDEGKSEREVVRELRLTPEAVQILHDKWLDGGGSDRVLTPNAWEAIERAIGPFRSVTELVERITQLKNLDKTASAVVPSPVAPAVRITDPITREGLYREINGRLSQDRHVRSVTVVLACDENAQGAAMPLFHRTLNLEPDNKDLAMEIVQCVDNHYLTSNVKCVYILKLEVSYGVLDSYRFVFSPHTETPWARSQDV